MVTGIFLFFTIHCKPSCPSMVSLTLLHYGSFLFTSVMRVTNDNSARRLGFSRYHATILFVVCQRFRFWDGFHISPPVKDLIRDRMDRNLLESILKKRRIKPLPNMPILRSSNSAANKDMT